MALQSSQEKGKTDRHAIENVFVSINTEKLQIMRSVDNLWSKDGCIRAHGNRKELVPSDTQAAKHHTQIGSHQTHPLSPIL